MLSSFQPFRVAGAEDLKTHSGAVVKGSSSRILGTALEYALFQIQAKESLWRQAVHRTTARRVVGGQDQEEFKHFIHHGVSMILRLAIANENGGQVIQRTKP